MSGVRHALLCTLLVAVLASATVPGTGGTGVATPATNTSTPTPTEQAGTPSSPPTGTAATPTTGAVGSCPSFRGAAALCEPTPTPTRTSTPTEGSALARPPTADDDAGTTARAERDGSTDWLSGLAPVLSWAALVTVVAPVVLGALLALLPERPGDGQ